MSTNVIQGFSCCPQYSHQVSFAEKFSECLSKAWKVFTNILNSCLKCLGFFSQERFNAEREFHLIEDARIPLRLQSQMDHAFSQMRQEPSKFFHYQEAPRNWDRHEENVGGYAVGISHAQGKRPTMEDEHLAVSFNLNISGRNFPLQLFGIFDGHGGPAASQYVRDHLKTELEKALIEFNGQGLTDEGIWKALKLTTVRLNHEFKQHFGSIAKEQGTTATIAMILDQKIWTANVGDSRTVLDNNGQPIQLTEDAKPDDSRYKKGIEKRGGRVFVNGCPRVNGDLAIARAIGDHRLNGAVSARSKITMKPLSEVVPGSHLVLCCDGIYDVASTRSVVSAVHSHKNRLPGDLAANITYSAEKSGSGDNLSCMVIRI